MLALRPVTVIAAAALLLATPARNVVQAQAHVHTPGMSHRETARSEVAASPRTSDRPTMPGQAAFGALAEIVRLLDADPATDWSRVDLEALRQHLRDMDDVTLRAAVRRELVTGGARFLVEGEGRTRTSIRRMVRAHATTIPEDAPWRFEVVDRPRGVLVTVRARSAADARTVARIRALGIVGLLTEGDHHASHHLAMARGLGAAAHQHQH